MRIALDTNILLRLITKDNPVETEIAKNTVNKAAEQNTVFISCIVLIETVWTLQRFYKFPKTDLITIIRTVLSTNIFDIEHHECCVAALNSFTEQSADFADYLIAEIAKTNYCNTTITFDKKALRSPNFTHPQNFVA